MGRKGRVDVVLADECPAPRLTDRPGHPVRSPCEDLQLETGLPMWTAFTVELPGRATEVVQVVGLQHVVHIPGLLFGDNTPADQLAEQVPSATSRPA